MYNEKTASNLEAAAVIARRTACGETVNVGFDVANYLQEMADRLRKEQHELSEGEMSDLFLSYKAMLVFE